ncbi:MAG: iron-sulfur cluster assembly scaffold protein [Proteobacteria bacterium]|nr:iron-sulfur cluster assembly scaffold protein [Pseudomonadota bacterium]
MTDELYHDAIMAHARAPHHAGSLPDADGRATVDNPLCGDRVTIELKLADDRVAAVGQTVRGCALCQASASMLADGALGAARDEVAAARDTIRAMLRDAGPPPAGRWAAFAAFLPARPATSRHDCVLLPFQAFERAVGQPA